MPGERYDEDSDEERAVRECNYDPREDEELSGTAREGVATQLEGDSTSDGGTSNELRIVMEEMEVGEKETAEGDGLVGKNEAEAEGEGLGGGGLL